MQFLNGHRSRTWVATGCMFAAVALLPGCVDGPGRGSGWGGSDVASAAAGGGGGLIVGVAYLAVIVPVAVLYKVFEFCSGPLPWDTD